MQLCVLKMPVMCMCVCVDMRKGNACIDFNSNSIFNGCWHQQYLSSIAMHFIYIEWYRLSWTKKKKKQRLSLIVCFEIQVFLLFKTFEIHDFPVRLQIITTTKSVLWNLKVSWKNFSVKQRKTMSLLMVWIWMRKTKDFSSPALNNK